MTETMSRLIDETGKTYGKWEVLAMDKDTEHCTHKKWNNGIDRIDNTKGYVPDNCRTSCKICNKAKSEMTEALFKELIGRIHANLYTRRVK